MSDYYDTEKSHFASGRSGFKPLRLDFRKSMARGTKVDFSQPLLLLRTASRPERLALLVFLL